MKVMLNDHWVNRLRECPESGMGYHVVDITLNTGVRVDNVVVFNSTEAVWPVAEQAAVSVEEIAAMEPSLNFHGSRGPS